MSTHVALYKLDDGAVLQLFARATSDNIATLATDLHLDVDGVVVAAGVDVATIGAVALESPTADDVDAPPGTMWLDDIMAPGDVYFGAEIGSRDPTYFGDTDSKGDVLMEP